MLTIDDIVTDRGSKYAVSGAPCTSAQGAKALIKELKRNKRFARATHNSWGLITTTGPIKHDDGESGAGAVILRMIARAELTEHLIVVTRWYGGRHLGGDRFRHVQTAVRAYLSAMS